jgi:S-adenosylmethionine hydrolase
MSRCLTLLSDFGLHDSYVGVMKGAIASINPHLQVIDLSHEVPPQNIAQARFTLMTSFPYFPLGTVHVAVVDPGVGGTRRAIALAVGKQPATPTGFLVGPDNGLFSGILTQEPVIAAIELTSSQYWRTPNPSFTFHGRDIFAPVGAHLASGVSIQALGIDIAPDSLVRLDIPDLLTQMGDNGVCITGNIQAIDHFGNLITTIPAERVVGKDWSVGLGDLEFPGRNTYSDRAAGEVLALVGSHGWVEIAVNGGNAQAKLGLNWGSGVQVRIRN